MAIRKVVPVGQSRTVLQHEKIRRTLLEQRINAFLDANSPHAKNHVSIKIRTGLEVVYTKSAIKNRERVVSQTCYQNMNSQL